METRSKRRKRQRLISISSHVSPRRPDLPAIFESLNDDTLTTVLEFVGDKSYRSFSGTNKRCKEVYVTTKGMTKETFLYGYAPLAVITDRYNRTSSLEARKALSKGIVLYNRNDVLNWALHERNYELLNGICVLAAQEGRTDLLNEVWNSVNDEGDKDYIFLNLDELAAEHGKLNVIKWLETKGFVRNKIMCSFAAAKHGHLHILQWIIEKQDLQIFGGLYNSATKGDNLHVLKWLREQEVNWHYDTFRFAAKEGNLDILQWLHDESCPWTRIYFPSDYRVREEQLTTEVIDWLRSHGYGDRIYSFF